MSKTNKEVIPTDAQLGIDKARMHMQNLASSIRELAKEYAAAYKAYPSHASKRYRQVFPSLTWKQLKLLIDIDNNVAIPELLLCPSVAKFNVLREMPLEDQIKAYTVPIEVWEGNGTTTTMMFCEMDPTTVAQVYDSRAKFFRTLAGQQEYYNNKKVLEAQEYSRTVRRAEALATGSNSSKPTPPFTKEQLIKLLKDLKPNAQDLAEVTDTITLMEAAKLSMTTVKA